MSPYTGLTNIKIVCFFASSSIICGYLLDKYQLMQSDKLFAGHFWPVGVENITIFVAFFGVCWNTISFADQLLFLIPKQQC